MRRILTFLWFAALFCKPAEAQHVYNTSFPLTENPISESGQWINGQTVGIDWKNVRTTPGLAFGTNSSTGVYDDSTALLVGTWGPNQTFQAKIHSVNQQSGNVYEEVEFRLRSTLQAHLNTGYEVNFRCNHDSTWYTDIVRWNGARGNYTILSHQTSGPGIRDGDIVKATIIGNVITSYINGVQVNQAVDSTFTAGNPGIGFFLDGGPVSLNSDFGFANFSVTDGSIAPPAAPANVRIIKLAASLSSPASTFSPDVSDPRPGSEIVVTSSTALIRRRHSDWG